MMIATRWTLAWVAALAVMMTMGVAHADDKGDVAKANEQFYAALNDIFKGDIAPMDAIWSEADDVTYLPPDGKLLVGWWKVRGAWQEQTSMNLGGHVGAENIHIVVQGDLAVVQNFEKGKNTNVEGKEQAVSIRATNVFRNESGAWKMISHHTDPLPFLRK